MVSERCQRCRGDMFIEQELGGVELVCLQCGRRRALDETMVRRIREASLFREWVKRSPQGSRAPVELSA